MGTHKIKNIPTNIGVIDVLNAIMPGWKEEHLSGMIVNENNGDIIDCAYHPTKTWFVIGDFGCIEFLETRNDAILAYIKKMMERAK